MVSDNSKQLNFTLDSRASRFSHSRGRLIYLINTLVKHFFLVARMALPEGSGINIQIYSNALGHYTKLIPINI
jgi:hypothetical protein